MKKSALSLLIAVTVSFAQAEESRFETAPDFQVRDLLSSQTSANSWQRLGLDQEGRLFLSRREGGLLRVTLPGNLGTADLSEIKTEVMPVRLTDITGMAWGRNSLHLAGKGPSGSGVYRLLDRNNNGLYESGEEDLVIPFKGEIQDGPRDIAFGPDGFLYLLSGIAAPAAARPSDYSPLRSIQEGTMLPSWPDPTGADAAMPSPAVRLFRFDFDNRELELLAGGMGSARDLAFHENGDLLTLEGESTRDRGLPWHRPARLLHLVPGGDYGWRSGTGVWPDRWADQNPPVGNVATATPAGISFCGHNGFSARFRGSVILADGSSPRLLAVKLREEGSSSAIEKVETLARAPQGAGLSIGDITFGTGGNLYFLTTDSRGVSSLQTLIFLGEKKDETPLLSPEPALRGMRREMEKLAAKPVARWLDSIWLNLDRANCQHVTQAVRRALESSPSDLWKTRALEEKEPARALAALFALARSERDRLARHELFDSLLIKLPACDDVPLRSLALRTLALARERLGDPRPETLKSIRFVLRSWLSLDEPALSLDVAASLVALSDPDVVKTCVPYLDSDRLTDLERIELITSLLSHPATLDQQSALTIASHLNRIREAANLSSDLKGWLKETGLPQTPGVNFSLHLDRLKQTVWKKLPRDPRAFPDVDPDTLEQRLKASSKALSALPLTGEFWSLKDDSLLAAVPEKFTPSAERGRTVFDAARCSICHDSTAPFLDKIGERLSRSDLLKALLSPSENISQKHAFSAFTLANGIVVEGRVLSETVETIVLQPSLQATSTLTLKQSEIKARSLSKRSPMPENLLAGFSHKKIADLLAYLGNPTPAEK